MTELVRDLETVETACRKLSDHEAVAALPSGGWNAQLWEALEQMGVTLLPISEDRGGAGSDLTTTAALLRALGRHAAPVPAAETAFLAGWLIEACGAEVPSGPLTATVAPRDVGLVRTPDGWSLTGCLPRVPWARHCDVVAVLVGDPSQSKVVLIGPGETHVDTGVNLAGEPRDSLHCDQVPLAEDCVLTLPEDSGVSAESFHARGALGRALLMAGCAETAAELSVHYVHEREQFGRPLAKFQAIQHHLAQMAGEALALRVAADTAALALAEGTEPGIAIAAAKATAGTAAGTIASLAHQVHGAIGITDEHRLHLTTTRLWAWRDEHGNEREWALRLGEEALLHTTDDLWARLLRP